MPGSSFLSNCLRPYHGGDKAWARPGHIQTSKHPSCALNVLAPRSYASTPPSLLPLFPVRCQLNPKGPVWRAGAYSPSKSPPTGISGGLTPGTVLVQGTESGELHFPSFPLTVPLTNRLLPRRNGSQVFDVALDVRLGTSEIALTPQ